jgi:HSP20 family protein
MLSRRLGYVSPWDEMERLRREMNRVFGQVRPRLAAAPCYPAMNVWINEEGAVVTAELPGVAPEDLDVAVVGDSVTVSGTRPEPELPEGHTYHRRERSCGSFTRTFQLPFAIEADKVAAKLEKGVLYLTLPRAEADRPKKIEIKAG